MKRTKTQVVRRIVNHTVATTLGGATGIIIGALLLPFTYIIRVKTNIFIVGIIVNTKNFLINFFDKGLEILNISKILAFCQNYKPLRSHLSDFLTVQNHHNDIS